MTVIDSRGQASSHGEVRIQQFLLLGLFALLIGCLITLFAGIRYQGPAQTARTRASSEISQRPTRSLPTLSLQAERDGADLRLTWDRNTATIVHARSGVLRIRDGDSKQQDLQLDAAQLRSHSVVYTPVTNNVQFRLEVSGANRQSASEWILILAAPTVQEPRVEAAKSAAPQQPLTAALSPRSASYAVQVGSFRNRADAERLSAEMEALYGPSHLVLHQGDPPLWRVLVGNETTIEGAGKLGERIWADRAAGQGGLPSRTKVVPLTHLQAGQTPAAPGASTRGVVPDQVVHQVLPDVPRNARDTIQGTVTVRVRVRVDLSGSVVAAALDANGPSRYFAELALRAARGWRFSPPKVDGREVANEWILRFEFGRTATKVFPARVSV